MRIHQIKGSGDDVYFKEVWTGTRNRDWTTLVPIVDTDHKYLLGYRATSGKAKIWELDSHGQGPSLSSSMTMQTDWSAFTPWQTPAGGKLLAYKMRSGTVRSFRLEAGGSGLDEVDTGTWLKGWQ
jgi:hypothetical protein